MAGRWWRLAPCLGGILLFEHRDNLSHDELHLADVGVSGPLHPYGGLGDVVQEAAHLVGDEPFVRCQLPRVLGVLPEVPTDRLLQDHRAIHHLELAGPPSCRVIFRKGNSREGWEGRGPAGQRAEVSIFFYFILFFRPNLMRDRKCRPKTKNGIFRSVFVDQKKKTILCDRILTISEQHFLIWRFRSRPRTEMGVIFDQRTWRSKSTARQDTKACAWPTHKNQEKTYHTRDTATHTPEHKGSDHKHTRAFEGMIVDSGVNNTAFDMHSSVAVATTDSCCTILLPPARRAAV